MCQPVPGDEYEVREVHFAKAPLISDLISLLPKSINSPIHISTNHTPLLSGVLALPRLELPVVELELLSFEDVAVGAAGLTRAGGDDGEETTSLELLFEKGIKFGGFFTLVKDTLDVVGLFSLRVGLGELSSSSGGLGVLRVRKYGR